MTETRDHVHQLARTRLGEAGRTFLDQAAAEIAAGVDDTRFATLISMASRHARGPLEPTDAERAEAARLLEGWEPERWTLLETLRVALVLARPDLSGEGTVSALEAVFEFADEGEQRALYRALAHLPAGERFRWRAQEGCRTNIVPVFEAIACDNPYPLRHFDDLAWNQLCIKAVFIGAPLWRVHGLDRRLSPELARMALDLVEERRSAGRAIQPELWLCLGTHGGERARAALEHELAGAGSDLTRRAALVGLARAGHRDALEAALADDPHGFVAGLLASPPTPDVFRSLL